MVMNNEVKTYLADRYFGGRIPGNLVRYLYDQYGEDPLAGELSPQFFWPYVIGDVKAYINGTLDIRIRTPIQKLKDRYDELEGITCSFAKENQALEKENAFLHDFIRYIHKETLYEQFRNEAHLEQDETGFSFYTL